jgi:hypothetical protein
MNAGRPAQEALVAIEERARRTAEVAARAGDGGLLFVAADRLGVLAREARRARGVAPGMARRAFDHLAEQASLLSMASAAALRGAGDSEAARTVGGEIRRLAADCRRLRQAARGEQESVTVGESSQGRGRYDGRNHQEGGTA